MTLLVISDTHGRVSRINDVIGRQIGRPDAVMFLGDVYNDVCRAALEEQNLFCVCGNCDCFSFFDKSALPAERILTLGNRRILMNHGDRLGVKYGYDRAAAYAARQDADILLCGHTHRRFYKVYPAGFSFGDVTLTRALHVFNPGSLGEPRDGQPPSFGIIEIRPDGILCSHGDY